MFQLLPCKRICVCKLSMWRLHKHYTQNPPWAFPMNHPCVRSVGDQMSTCSLFPASSCSVCHHYDQHSTLAGTNTISTSVWVEELCGSLNREKSPQCIDEARGGHWFNQFTVYSLHWWICNVVIYHVGGHSRPALIESDIANCGLGGLPSFGSVVFL